MKTIKIIPIVIILLFAISCDLINELFESDDPSGTGSIIGGWLESDATVSLVLTTNSNQTANNFLNSTGEISVTGNVQTKLPLMITLYEDDSNEDPLVIVTSTSGFLGYSDTTYLFTVIGNNNSTEAALLASDTLDYNAEFYTDQATYTFDGATLSVNTTTLQDDALQLSATVNGIIASQQVNISANSPKTLSFNASHFYDFGSTVTTFEEDSTFTSSEDTGIGDDTGTWEIVGDTLKITTEQEVEDPVTGETTYVDTTWTFNYVNNGNEIILSQTIDICDLEDDDMTCTEMYESIELLFGLGAGSVTDAQFIYQLFFERTTAKPSLNSIYSGRQKSSNPIFIIQRISDFRRSLDK